MKGWHKSKPGACLSRFLFVAALSLADTAAVSAGGFDFTLLNQATQDSVHAVIKPIALGAGHHPYASAGPVRDRLELGMDLTLLRMPSDFGAALDLLGSTANFPSSFSVPKLDLRLRLPAGWSLGLSGLSYLDYTLYGGDLQARISRQAGWVPATSLRASYSKAKFDVVETETQAVDLVMSRSFWILDPYVGLGFALCSGTLDVATGGAAGLPTGVSPKDSFSAVRWFAGLPISFLRVRLTVEYSGNTQSMTTTGVKASLGF